jgi:ATP/maltotriose-dependent transcriptional regulator MalT
MHTRAAQVVGREPELTSLERALSGARAGRGAAVFLVGEPGIGKSRLAAEAAGRAFAADMRVLRGRGSTRGAAAVPFRPLTEALMSLSRGGEPPPLGELGAYRPVLGRLIPDWSQDVAGSESLVILAEAVLRLMALLGRGGGCLLILEDMHDSDAETLAVLEYLLDNLQEQPFALLVTIRNEPSDALDLARSAAGRRAGTVLELDRLGPEQTRSLVAHCLDTDPTEVPDAALDRLWRNSAGNPFVVEELLRSMVDTGLLVPVGSGWRIVAGIDTEVPATLVRSIALRADRLGPQGRRLLSAAAVLGRRFPLSVVQQVTGMDDRNLLSHLHAGVSALLLIADEPAPDWYAFQHPVAGEALLAELTPTDRADLSRRAADAVEAMHPELPGEWRQLVASLREYAGDAVGAARHFNEAGRHALADGAARSAVVLLERAQRLLARHDDPETGAAVLETLLYALAEAGRFDRAFELCGTLDELGGMNLDTRRRAALRVRLVWVAMVAGRWSDAVRELAAAHALLGPDADDVDRASLDAAAAELAIEAPGAHRDPARAERLARQAMAAAQRAGLPAIVCQSWQVIGTVTRERDLAEAGECFRRARHVAEEHRLPIWRVYALVRSAGNDWLRHGDVANLEEAQRAAQRVGAVSLGYVVQGLVAMHAALCGRYELASVVLDECLDAVTRLKLSYVARYALLTRATVAAHQGKRREMELALTEFGECGDSEDTSLTHGLARAFCALMEEKSDLALRELDKARTADEDNPLTSHLAGHHGLRLFLRVRAGQADWPEYEAAAAAEPSRMRWNSQFTHLAHAVLLGRSGWAEQAEAAVAEAQRAAAVYGMAQHLGLRLVADAALADEWGDPQAWLRSAEEHFHQAEVPAVASACRALLRQAGASVRQRRTGTDRVPAALRALRVTVREYEVFELLADRPGNKTIAARLHISPRTVEKHIASLIVKIGLHDRDALNTYAASLLSRA